MNSLADILRAELNLIDQKSRAKHTASSNVKAKTRSKKVREYRKRTHKHQYMFPKWFHDAGFYGKKAYEEYFKLIPHTTRIYSQLEDNQKNNFKSTSVCKKYSPTLTSESTIGIHLNTEKYVTAIIVDCDHDDIDKIRELASVYSRNRIISVLPNFVVQNVKEYKKQPKLKLDIKGKKSRGYKKRQKSIGKFHAIFKLETPVNIGPNGKLGPIRKLLLAQKALAFRLGGDMIFASRVGGGSTKNIFNEEQMFSVMYLNDRAYSLDELIESCNVNDEDCPNFLYQKDNRYKGLALAEQDPNARNTTLFNIVRHIAYDEYRSNISQYQNNNAKSMLFDEIMVHAVEHNENFDIPLPQYDLDGICRSISKFCVDRLKPLNSRYQNEGILKNQIKDLSQKERQQAGAKYASSLVKSRTREAIVAALMEEPGLSVRKLAEKLSMSTRTIQKHLKELRQTTKTDESSEPQVIPSTVDNKEGIRLVVDNTTTQSVLLRSKSDSSPRLGGALNQRAKIQKNPRAGQQPCREETKFQKNITECEKSEVLHIDFGRHTEKI